MGIFSTKKLNKAASEGDASKSHTVLIVDDEPENLIILNDILEEEYNVLKATNGQEALELIRNDPDPERIQLIISDQRMPKLMGIEFLSKTIEIIPRTIRIILTGFTDVTDIIGAINKGQIYKFILKPFDRDDLLLTVKRALERYDLEKQHYLLNQNLTRFVPQEFLELLNKKGISEIQLGDQTEGTMSVLFSDIRSFTALSEVMSPQENFKFINSYLSHMGPIIREHKGLVDKYIGDAIMALFPGSVEDAIDASVAMLSTLRVYNSGRKRAKYYPISIGIGVNTGPLMLGIIGEQHRLDVTVISDAVNLASRIENLTKFYQIPLIVSGHTMLMLKDPFQYQYRLLDYIRVKGKSNPVPIYEFFDPEEPELNQIKEKAEALIIEGLELRKRKHWDQAIACFQDALVDYPEDNTLKVHIALCEELQTVELPEDWDGAKDLEQTY